MAILFIILTQAHTCSRVFSNCVSSRVWTSRVAPCNIRQGTPQGRLSFCKTLHETGAWPFPPGNENKDPSKIWYCFQDISADLWIDAPVVGGQVHRQDGAIFRTLLTFLSHLLDGNLKSLDVVDGVGERKCNYLALCRVYYVFFICICLLVSSPIAENQSTHPNVPDWI